VKENDPGVEAMGLLWEEPNAYMVGAGIGAAIMGAAIIVLGLVLKLKR